MTTTVTKTVGTASRDYATFALAIAAIAGRDITAAGHDEIWIFNCYNDSEFAISTPSSPIIDLQTSPPTTDSSHTVTFQCAAGQSFTDNAGRLTNALRYNASNGVGVRVIAGASFAPIQINASNITVIGFQFANDETAGQVVMGNVATDGTCTFIDCLFSGNDGSGISAVVTANSGRFVNCWAIARNGQDGWKSAFDRCVYHNCGAIQLGASGSSVGYTGHYDTPLALNCVSFGFATCFQFMDSGSDYNTSSDATAPGAHSLHSKAASSQFQDVSGPTTLDLRVKTGSDIAGAGTRDQTFTNDLDIVGSPRSTTVPTQGPWEFASGGGGSPPLLGQACL